MKRLKTTSPTETGAVTARRLTLIAVDDEPSNVNILDRIFHAEYNVLKAASGSEALALLRSHRDADIVAILSDQRMPGMSGVELLAKAAEERPEIARVLVTGYSDMEAIVAAINLAHVMHYVSKPYEPATIRQVVQRAVEERARQREIQQRMEELRRSNAELQSALHKIEERGRGGK